MKDLKLEDVPYFVMERAMRVARDLTKEVFRTHGFGITIDQWLILKSIADESGAGISQVEIANNTFKDPAAVTRILDILARKGLVIRQASPDDRRTHEVYLTPAGKELFGRILPIVKEIRQMGLEGLAEKEVEAMKQAVNRIFRNLDSALSSKDEVAIKK